LIFDKESGNIHRQDLKLSQRDFKSDKANLCKFHIKHCSQSESNLSGFYCVIHSFVVQQVESILKREKLTTENRQRKPATSSWITSYFAKEQRKDSQVLLSASVAIFRADFARAAGSK